MRPKSNYQHICDIMKILWSPVEATVFENKTKMAETFQEGRIFRTMIS